MSNVTEDLIADLEKRIAEEEKRELERAKKASKLLKKFPAGDEDNDYIRHFICMYYGEESWANTSEYDMIDFHTDGMKSLAGGETLSYDDYIELQFRSPKSNRYDFINCYFNYPIQFKGCIERITKENILFKRIFVTGMFPDATFFDGKEDHVWMSRNGFEDYKVGDCVQFFAEVYRYIKKGNGKAIDYSLRNPGNIKKIEAYELPTDEELLEQMASEIICDSCGLRETCINGGSWCLRNHEEIEALKKDIVLSLSLNEE